MGLTSEEFFELTPRQFHALVLRYKERNERAELLMGIQTAVLANHSYCAPKKPYSAYDFMPSKSGEREREAPKPKKFNRQKFADSIRTAMSFIPAGYIVKKTADTKINNDGATAAIEE